MKSKLVKIYQYVAVFEPDLESGGFTVSIPGLPGCLTEGDTFEEALANIKEAASLYLEVLADERKKVPHSGTGVIITPIEVTV